MKNYFNVRILKHQNEQFRLKSYLQFTRRANALKPAQPRDSARLLVFDIAKNKIEHHQVKDLPQFLPKNSVLVLNESKVLPARLTGHRLSKNKKTGAYLGWAGFKAISSSGKL